MLKLDDNVFIIENVSQNPAKDIQAKVKLIHNEIADDIGEYELTYLNPKGREVISDISKTIESKLENLKLVVKTIENRTLKTNGGEESLIIRSKKIKSDFKITCKADIRIPKWVNTHKFQYNFEISYTKCLIDELGNYIGVPHGHEDNYIITIKPSGEKYRGIRNRREGCTAGCRTRYTCHCCNRAPREI